MFITFEGIDGSGKTTQVELLKKWLNTKGIRVKVTEEPTKDLETSQVLQEHLKNPDTEQWVDAILFAADRALHIEKVIMPSLMKGLTVICDRYIHSSIAYQTAMGLNKEWVINLNKCFPKPNLTIYLDAPVKTAINRVNNRNKSKDKYEMKEVLKKVRDEYLLLKSKRFIIINGDKSIKEVHEDIKGVLNDFM